MVMQFPREVDVLHNMVRDAAQEAFARVVLPAILRNLLFQPASLLLIVKVV